MSVKYMRSALEQDVHERTMETLVHLGYGKRGLNRLLRRLNEAVKNVPSLYDTLKCDNDVSGQRKKLTAMLQNRAMASVRYALKRDIIKRLPCEVCASEHSKALHDSYYPDKWFELHWFCPEHAKAHRAEVQAIYPTNEEIESIVSS